MDRQSRIANIVNSKFYPLLLFFVSFVFVALFSRSTSFLYVFEGGDPSIFKQMGLALLRGKTLYIDYFDNKGCIIYFIHALGLWLGGNFAIMMMQTLSLTLTLLIWDKMLALYRNEKQRLVCLGIALIMLLCFYRAGDQTQEWCLPYISFPLLIYFQTYKTETEIRPSQMFLIGLCFGIIAFIQVNNACAFLGFLAFLWILYLLKKDFRKFFSSLACFLSGLIIVAAACSMYFYIKAGWHGIYELYYGTFLSNLEYLGAEFEQRPFSAIPYFVFLLAFTLIQLFKLHKVRDILIPMLIALAFFAVSFGKLGNMYYLIALLPLCIVSMMTIDFSHNTLIHYVLYGIAIVCLAYYACNPLIHFVEDLVLHKEKDLVIYDEFHHCIENIPESERDSIYNYNLYSHGTSMMQHEGLVQCNRTLFTSLVFSLPTLWEEEVSHPFVAPKWMILSWDIVFQDEDASFIVNNYDLCCEFEYNKLYFEKPKVGEAFKVYVYRRKE